MISTRVQYNRHDLLKITRLQIILIDWALTRDRVYVVATGPLCGVQSLLPPFPEFRRSNSGSPSKCCYLPSHFDGPQVISYYERKKRKKENDRISSYWMKYSWLKYLPLTKLPFQPSQRMFLSTPPHSCTKSLISENFSLYPMQLTSWPLKKRGASTLTWLKKYSLTNCLAH